MILVFVVVSIPKVNISGIYNNTLCIDDGSMNTQAREKSLNKLRTDPECKIMLISLKCGALGYFILYYPKMSFIHSIIRLNLTATNRVILMDLWWNPAVERNCLLRKHQEVFFN